MMNTLYRFRSPDLYISRTRDDTPQADNFPMHTHSTAEIYCFLSGKGTYHIEGSEYPLEAGDILLMRPAEAHFIEISSDFPYERICINLDTRIFSSIDPDNTLMRPFFHRKPGKRNHYSARDFGSNDYRTYLSKLEQDNKLQILPYLILLLQEIGSVFDRAVFTDVQPETIEYRMLSFINSHLDQDLSLEKLCNRFFISRTQLSRKFKKATGSSVGKYIAAKRLMIARELLLQGQQAAEVSIACGYSNYSTFYRAYCAYFGCSPSQKALSSPLCRAGRDNNLNIP